MNSVDVFEKRNQMMKCDHLFVKQTEEEWDGLCHTSDAFYIPPQICCLKCGLNNRFLLFSDRRKYDYETYMALSIFPQFRLSIINDEIFENQFMFGWRDRCAVIGANRVFNLISDEVLNCDNPEELYEEAKSIIPDGNIEEIFTLIKKLNTQSVKKKGEK